MQLLIRKYSSKSGGNSEFTDIELLCEKIRLGSAADSELQLLGSAVLAKHAVISQQAEQFVIQSGRQAALQINGEPEKKANLSVGDTFSIASHEFEVIVCPQGFDFALLWHEPEVDAALLANAYKTRLSANFVGPRMLAWLLFFIVAAVLVAAFADFGLHAGKDKNLRDGRQDLRLSKLLSSGPLHKAHQSAIGDQCEACHEKAFVQVKDSTCTACHEQSTDHLPTWHKQHTVFDEFSCQNCHKEHNEPTHITISDSALCVNCHSDEKPAISGFSKASHSDFELTLLQPQLDRNGASFSLSWQHERIAAGAAGKENSHLKFPHDLHLDVKKVFDEKTEEQLACSSCHELQADGEHFKPIEMAANCRSCHDLSFAPDRPQLQLPHGQPEQVWQMLEAHFINQSFSLQSKEERFRRRVPAKELVSESCKNDLACAGRLATAEAETQFTVSGCVTCHEVETLGNVEPRSRWQVLPVKLNSDWYSRARFDHRSHLTQSGEQANALCLSCHEADKSNLSSDILIPAKDNCLQCHDDSGHGQMLKLDCVSCHAYHLSEQRQLFKPLEALQGAKP